MYRVVIGLMGGALFTWLALVVFVVALGGFCFDYSLDTYFGKDIPWYGDCVAGTLGGGVVVPASIIGWVLVQCDVPEPIFYPSENDAGK